MQVLWQWYFASGQTEISLSRVRARSLTRSLTLPSLYMSIDRQQASTWGPRHQANSVVERDSTDIVFSAFMR